MANLITLIRLILVFVVTALALYAKPYWQILCPILAMLILSLDGLDGIIARKRNESSLFGAIFDIAADRIIEITIWVTLLNANLVPIWIPLVVITRGILTDTLRKKHSDMGRLPFSIMQTSSGRFIVASRKMRLFLGTLKFITFPWLLSLIPLPYISPTFWFAYQNKIILIGNILVYTTLTISILRGIPVILEALFLDNPISDHAAGDL